MIRIIPLKRDWSLRGSKYSDIEDYISFEEFVARSYINEIKRVVKTQKYRWVALNPKYLEYKRKTGRNEGKWISTGTLIKNLTLSDFRGNKAYFTVGFKKVKDLDLNLICRCNEFGTLTIPPRPLFRRTLTYYKAKLPDLYKKYEASAKASKTMREKSKRQMIKDIIAESILDGGK